MLQPSSTFLYLDKIKDRFYFAFQPTFNTKKPPVAEPYLLTVLNKDCSIWLTNPALLLFVTCDFLTPLTTSPERVKVISSSIYDLPISEYTPPEKEFDYIFSVTDFTFNRNISTDNELSLEIEKLSKMQETILQFFNSEMT